MFKIDQFYLLSQGLKTMKEMSYSRETQSRQKKKKRQWKKDVHKYLMSIIKQKGHLQQNSRNTQRKYTHMPFH